MICTKCKTDKDLMSEFYPSRIKRKWFICKSCVKQQVEEFKKNHPNKPSQYNKKWRKEHPEQWLEIQRKWNECNSGRLIKKAKSYRERNKKRIAEFDRAYVRIHPERSHAHHITHKAIKRGILVKQPCETCGSLKAHAHHEDYSKPLEVTWLCQRHHQRLHRGRTNEKARDCKQAAN